MSNIILEDLKDIAKDSKKKALAKKMKKVKGYEMFDFKKADKLKDWYSKADKILEKGEFRRSTGK